MEMVFGHRYLKFLFLHFFLVLVLVKTIYPTLKNMIDQIFKYHKVHHKYTPLHVVFSSLHFVFWKCGRTWSLVCKKKKISLKPLLSRVAFVYICGQ